MSGEELSPIVTVIELLAGVLAAALEDAAGALEDWVPPAEAELELGAEDADLPLLQAEPMSSVALTAASVMVERFLRVGWCRPLTWSACGATCIMEPLLRRKVDTEPWIQYWS
jgi:hypothetical protein